MKTIVYISYISRKIKVVTGAAQGDKLAVKRCLSADIPADTGEAARLWQDRAVFLAGFWHDNHLPTRDVRLIIDMESVLAKKLELPVLPKKQVYRLIGNEFAGQFAEDVDYLLDYMVLSPKLPGENAGGVVLATAVERELVRQYAELFGGIGVQLESLDIALNAAVRVLSRLANAQTFICAVLEAGTIGLFLFVDGMYSFSNMRRLLEKRGTPAAAVEISRNISSMVQFSISQRTKSDIAAVLVCGLTKEEMLFAENMSQSLNIPVSVLADNCQWIAKSGQADECQFCCSEYLYALGGLY